MSSDTPNPIPDASSHPSSNSSTSPPFADAVVRPFTSQGSSCGTSLQPLTNAYPPSGPSPDSPIDPPNAKFEPYSSASARTSYTRVDVDSLPVPEYPPLPPLPTAFAQDVPVVAADTAFPATTTTTPTPDPNGAQNDPIPQTPQVTLTFLLVSGRRKSQSFDPDTTVGRVKELVWNAWPGRDADWQDERPPAPSYLRILYLGRILQDDETLLRIGFPASLPSANTPTIVHLSIRPYMLPSDDPAFSKKKRLSILTRRLSTGGVGGGEERETDGAPRRAGCCTGCTIC